MSAVGATGYAVDDGRFDPDCRWSGGFELYGVDGEVHALAVYDDGSGPALYVGGDFRRVSGLGVRRIARWDGTAWSPLGDATGFGVDQWGVTSLAVYDDGSGPALYVGGSFTVAGGVAASNIARWDGVAWSALDGPSGNGVSGPSSYVGVHSLAVYDGGSGPALYVGGLFTEAGGVPVSNVARWDGATWSAVGTGTGGYLPGGDPSVRALTVADDGTGPALYAGGGFTTAGGVTVNGVARWDGGQWSALSGPSGTGIDSRRVLALAGYDDATGPALYVGGSFSAAGGVAASSIARWDGGAWSAVVGPTGNGVTGAVTALAVHDDGSGPALYAGLQLLGSTADLIARWDGSDWSSVGQGLHEVPYSSMGVGALAVFDDGGGAALVAGGVFNRADGVAANNLASWGGTAWSPLPAPPGSGVDAAVWTLEVAGLAGGTALFAGGEFTIAGGVAVDNVARWDGVSWSSLGAGTDGAVRALRGHDDGSGPALYAGGLFTSTGGVTARNVARWDGAEWSAMSYGLAGQLVGSSGDAFDLEVYDDGTGPGLYACGGFTHAGGVPVNGIARWDGSAWSALGTGFDRIGRTMVVWDDGGGPALYVGGQFATAGGIVANCVARWDGVAWSPLFGPSAPGVSGGEVTALAVYDDGSGPALYAGGTFDSAGGLPVSHVARWDGTSWSALEGPAGTGVGYAVWSLAAYDDGTGPALAAGGTFTSAGGVEAQRIARWDGRAWSPLEGPYGNGVEYSGSFPMVAALAPFDDGAGPGLFAGGWFYLAGGLPSSSIARWRCKGLVFVDGFESGATSAWSLTIP